MQHSPEPRRDDSTAVPDPKPLVEPADMPTPRRRTSVPSTDPATDYPVDAVNTVRINPPEMDLQDLPSFFWSLEHWFAASGITSRMDSKRFHLVMAQIPVRALSELRPLLENVPSSDRYQFAKRTILTHFEESQRSRLHRLLSGMELGDRKPSQLLAEMRRASNGAMVESLLVDLWIGRLPQHVQSAVIAARGNTADKAGVADAVMDCFAHCRQPREYHQMAEVRSSSAFEERISREVAELNRKLSDFMLETRHRGASQQRSRPQQRSRSQQRTSSRDTANEENRMCYYHRRFGAAARSCRSPCSFRAPASGSQTGQPSTC